MRRAHGRTIRPEQFRHEPRAVVPSPTSAYCAAEHAVQGFNDSLRSELFHHHSAVKITMVQLPASNTFRLT